MKKSIFLVLFGLIVMVSGCVPFGIAINNSVSVNEVFNESISLNKKFLSPIINVNSANFVLPSIKLHLTTTEVDQNNSNDYRNEYEAKYRFPISLVITDNYDKKIYEYQGKLDWKNGTKSYHLNNVNSRFGEVVVDIDLDKISIPAPGDIKVSVSVTEDKFYFAKLLSANLIVYDNVHEYTANILIGVAIIMVGILIFIIGVILLILKQINSQTSSPKKVMNNDTNENTNIDSNLKNSSVTSTAMLCHLSTFAGLIIPFGGVLGPLIMWQIKKDEDPFINRHGIAALNFHLSMMIYYFVSFLLAFVVVGFFLLMILAVTELILVIIASIKASNGEEYQYPLAIKFIKVTEE